MDSIHQDYEKYICAVYTIEKWRNIFVLAYTGQQVVLANFLI